MIEKIQPVSIMVVTLVIDHISGMSESYSKKERMSQGAGAYAPEWFMGPLHQNPYDAVQAFQATGAKTFIPFHYGTFDSAD